MKNNELKLKLNNIKGIKKIIDINLRPENYKALNWRQKAKYKAFKKELDSGNYNRDEFVKRFMKYQGVRKDGTLSNKFKKKGVYKKQGDNWFISLTFKPKQRYKTSNNNSIEDFIINWPAIREKVNEFNVLQYQSDFSSDWYIDWVDRFKKAIGCEQLSSQLIIQWILRFENDLNWIHDRYSLEEIIKAIELVKKKGTNITPKDGELAATILQILFFK